MWAEWENVSPQVSVPGAETSVNVVKQVLAATFDSQHWLPYFEAAYEWTLLNFWVLERILS